MALLRTEWVLSESRRTYRDTLVDTVCVLRLTAALSAGEKHARIRVCMESADVSPTVFRVKGWRFYFFANEEPRVHVHVVSPRGEAKFWLEPIVALAMSRGFSKREIKEIQKIVEKRQNEIQEAWKKFFSKRS